MPPAGCLHTDTDYVPHRQAIPFDQGEALFVVSRVNPSLMALHSPFTGAFDGKSIFLIEERPICFVLTQLLLQEEYSVAAQVSIATTMSAFGRR